MCYSILNCQHAAQTHHAASEHHRTSWQSRSCLCGITPFIVTQDEKQGEQQAAGGHVMAMQDEGDDQEDMPTTGQLSFDPLHDLNYSSGSPSSQHVPQPASRFASAKPGHQSTFSNPAHRGACLPCHSGSRHLRPLCFVLFSQAICLACAS